MKEMEFLFHQFFIFKGENVMTLIQKLRKSKAGFTLIELIVVIAILAILAAILVPAMVSYLNRAKKGSEESDVRAAYSAAASAFTMVQTGSSPISGAASAQGSTTELYKQTVTLLYGEGVTAPPSGITLTIKAGGSGVTEIALKEGTSGCTCTYNASTKTFTHSDSSHS